MSVPFSPVYMENDEDARASAEDGAMISGAAHARAPRRERASSARASTRTRGLDEQFFIARICIARGVGSPIERARIVDRVGARGVGRRGPSRA